MAIAAASVCTLGCDSSPKPSASEAESRPAAVVTEPGLEVVNWVTSADDLRVASALTRLAAPVPGVPAAARQRWQASGLRILSIPVDRISELESALPGSGSTHRQWLGQALVWTPLVTGPAITEPTTLATDADRVRLAAGAMRLLTRCWLEPAAPDPVTAPLTQAMPAVLRIELVPQHRESVPPERELLQPSSISPLDDGVVFSRLSLNLAATPNSALVIVGEDPRILWDQPAPEPEPGPRVLTIGEAMLIGRAPATLAVSGPTPPARTRSVVLLLPRVPAKFSLTPAK